MFLCVPTPQADDGSADLSYIEAAREVGPGLEPEAVVDQQVDRAGGLDPGRRAGARPRRRLGGLEPRVPARGLGGARLPAPDRIVIGGDDQAAAIRVARVVRDVGSLIVTDPASAETIKYASNAFLATKVSFVNAIANVCEAVGADVNEVVLGMGYDKRIGLEFLRPGPGWGGSCFPKDTRALVRIAEDAGLRLRSAQGRHPGQRRAVRAGHRQDREAAGQPLEGKTSLRWGLTFKARTDDLRDSPAIEVIEPLRPGRRSPGVRLPRCRRSPLDGVEVCADPYAACERRRRARGAHRVGRVPLARLRQGREALVPPRVVDARNLLDPAAMRRRGFIYEGIGRSEPEAGEIVVTGGAGFLGLAPLRPRCSSAATRSSPSTT